MHHHHLFMFRMNGMMDDEIEEEGDAIAVQVPQFEYPFHEDENEEISQRCNPLEPNQDPATFDNSFRNCVAVVNEIMNR